MRSSARRLNGVVFYLITKRMVGVVEVEQSSLMLMRIRIRLTTAECCLAKMTKKCLFGLNELHSTYSRKS